MMLLMSNEYFTERRKTYKWSVLKFACFGKRNLFRVKGRSTNLVTLFHDVGGHLKIFGLHFYFLFKQSLISFPEVDILI